MPKPRARPPQSILRQGVIGLLIALLGGGPLALGYVVCVHKPTQPNPPVIAAVPPPTPQINEPIAPPLVPGPPPPSAPPVAAPAPVGLVRAEVELVDCVAAGAPAWCRQVRSAHARERRGTIVAVVRSPDAGDVFACSGGRHIGQMSTGDYAPDSLRKKLDARLFDRVPRDTASGYDYYVRPAGSPLADPAWMSPCP